MPRSYAKLLTTIWDDPDFVALPATAQRLYALLMSQKDLTLCGALHMRVRPWSKLAPDTPAEDIERDFATLCEHRFVVVDLDTEEALIRTFIRHDGGVNNRNIHKGICNAIDRVQSAALRGIATIELSKAAGHTPYEDPPPDPSEHPPNGHGNLPAACSPTPNNPAASSRAEAPPPPTFPGLPPPAAAALVLFIDHRMRTDRNIVTPTTYRRTLEEKLPIEHGDILRQAANTMDNARDIAFAVFGIGSPPPAIELYQPIPPVPPLSRAERDALLAKGKAEARHLSVVDEPA